MNKIQLKRIIKEEVSKVLTEGSAKRWAYMKVKSEKFIGYKLKEDKDTIWYSGYNVKKKPTAAELKTIIDILDNKFSRQDFGLPKSQESSLEYI